MKQVKNKMSNYLKLGIFLLIIPLTLWNCKKDIVDYNDLDKENLEITSKKINQNLYGKKLQNPYSVDNMNTALQNLIKNGRVANIPVRTTHYYVKFIPKNEKELELIEGDESLDLYNYPLDYDISNININDIDSKEWYAAVPIDYQFPNTSYKIIENLYIPEDDGIPEDNTNLLVDEALKITNNLKVSKETSRRRKWYPHGKIQLRNTDSIKYQGLEGVVVKARRWFRTRRMRTNADGDYQATSSQFFRRPAHFSIIWEDYGYKLRRRWSTVGYHAGRYSDKWDWKIKSGEQWYYATIYRAAYHYYSKDIKGLRRPPAFYAWHRKLKIRAHYDTHPQGDGIGGSFPSSYIISNFAINIWNPFRKSSKIYGTTIHELAHTSHWLMSRSDYRNGDNILVESWAVGVSWSLTTMYYPNYYPNIDAGFGYDSTIIQAIDGFHPVENDFVTGYTIKELEDALEGVRRWKDYHNNILNSYNNATENNLHYLFNF
jgi:hypothetical protein